MDGLAAAAVQAQLAADLPDAGLQQVEAVHEVAPHLHVLQRRRHGLGVLVLRRRRAAGRGRGRGGRAMIVVRRAALLLLLLQLPQLHENTTQGWRHASHRCAWTMYTHNTNVHACGRTGRRPSPAGPSATTRRTYLPGGRSGRGGRAAGSLQAAAGGGRTRIR